MNLKSLRCPDLYHERLGKNYFEGWYFKLVDREVKQAFAFIPGVFFSSVPEHDHAFIQIIDGIKKPYRYERFPTKEFSAARNTFSVAVAGNIFYEFTTMNRSKVEVIQKGTGLAVHFKNRRYSLTLKCETKSEDFILLNGPSRRSDGSPGPGKPAGPCSRYSERNRRRQNYLFR